MSEFVVDASVTMAWCFENQADDYTRSALRALSRGRAAAPHLWLLEVANSLVVTERRERFLPGDSDEFLLMIATLPIDIDTVAAGTMWLREVLSLARANALTTYDAAYLELAKRKGLPLATRDASLRRAANRIGVKLFAP